LHPGADCSHYAYPHVEEELGDLMYHVVFHSALAAEAGAFGLADVARGIHDKLVRRHPHVFGDASSEMADIARSWEEQKRAEKGRASAMDGVPTTLPALLYASKVLRKAELIGVTWESAAPGLGRRLLALVAEAREADLDPEAALRSVANDVAAAARARERGA
ncbi:MAG: MazG nucleotide pyrophosphohydrolase domain-containing protein, partial [Acidimicrobiales bacterium]